ncbi:MAG: hypothetical protein WBP64_15245, partial [Nitrososphaeraceae archaeon]
MPAKSKLLGFNCPRCGRNYGSIQYLRQKTREIKRKRRLLSKRNEVEAIEIPKRYTLNPVEYSLRNLIIAGTEEKLLDKVTKDLAELRRNGWPLSQPLYESDRIKLESYASRLKSRVEARKEQRQFEDIAESAWNVTEEVEKIDSSTYELMKKLGGDDIVIEDVNIEEEKEEVTNGSRLGIKWNPITIIRKYRCSVDPFRHLDFPMDFYAQVVGKHDYIYTQYLSENYEVLKQAFAIINRFRKHFSDRNYRYTLYEWFWIVRYAHVFTPGKSDKMLLALDGDGGKISLKHIRDMIRPVMKFWEKYFCYSPYFFEFLKIMHHPKEMLEEHLKTLQMKEDHNFVSGNNINDYYLGTNNDNFKAGKIGAERVRIHHSNPYYQKELKEFRNGLGKEKPKKKISCTFN